MRMGLIAILLLAATAGAAAADEGKNAPRAEKERDKDATPARLWHVPPAEAQPGAPLAIDATIDHAWQATLELRYRGVGETAFHAVANEWANRTHHMHEVLESIAGKVQIASGHYNAADKKAASFFG